MLIMWLNSTRGEGPECVKTTKGEEDFDNYLQIIKKLIMIEKSSFLKFQNHRFRQQRRNYASFGTSCMLINILLNHLEILGFRVLRFSALTVGARDRNAIAPNYWDRLMHKNQLNKLQILLKCNLCVPRTCLSINFDYGTQMNGYNFYSLENYVHCKQPIFWKLEKFQPFYTCCKQA